MGYCIRFFILIVLILAGVGFSAEDPNQLGAVWLLCYFKGNGEDGLHLAYSTDGLVWKPLKNDESFLLPQVGSKLMRDPSICRGGDGLFHMVWTTGWWDKGIGLARSSDLIQWSMQEFLGVMEHEPEAKNCWAPEIFFDESTQTYLIFWATTIPGRFPQTDNPKDDNNHRIYYITTKDFKTFSDAALFYEPGFNVIDAFIAKAGQRYVMFLKNETKHPKAEKNIRMAFADRAAGPYGAASEPITGRYWAEGPAAVKIGSRWIVYFDKYTQRRYGAIASADLIDWQDISDQLKLPRGAKHGTVFQTDWDVVKKLLTAGTE